MLNFVFFWSFFILHLKILSQIIVISLQAYEYDAIIMF